MTGTAKVDVEAAGSIVEAACRFDWTWSFGDAEDFCAVVGWTPTELTTSGMSATTTVAVDYPEAHFAFFRDKVGTITVNITDLVHPGLDPTATQFVLDSFSALSSRLDYHLGPPHFCAPGPQPVLVWEAPAVWVELAAITRCVKLRLISPAYREFTNHD